MLAYEVDGINDWVINCVERSARKCDLTCRLATNFTQKDKTLAFLRLNVRLRLRTSAECFVLSFACSIASVCLCCLLACDLAVRSPRRVGRVHRGRRLGTDRETNTWKYSSRCVRSIETRISTKAQVLLNQTLPLSVIEKAAFNY